MGLETLIYTDGSGNDVGALLDFDLDVSWGETEQDFTLITNTKIEPGAYVYQDGTEIGGVIDSYTTSTETDLRTYKGRSWHGILSYKVLEPDAGKDYLVFSGDLNSIIDQMIRRAGLTSIFKASSQQARVSVTWECERYTDLYYELKKLMRSCSCKLMMRHADGMVELYADDVNVISDEVDSDVMDFSIDTYHRVVNHLVCLGDGELKDRVVRHLYADAQGRVSTTQTFFGVDELEAVYDYNNADADELVEKGEERLLAMQSEGSVDVGTVDGGISAYVGDYIVARDNRNNAMVTAEVVQKIVKIQNGVMTVDYGVGSESNPMSRTIGGTAESTNSTAVYSAGQGISIVNNTISADVTQTELDSVSGVASSAASRANSAYTLAESKSKVSASQSLSAGTEIGSITIDGTETKLYAPEGSSGGTSYTELWNGNATANTSVTLKSDIQNYDAVEFTFTDGARIWTELVNNKKSNSVTTSVSGSFRSGVTDFTSSTFNEYIVNMHIAITGKSLKVNSTGRMYIRYNAVPICDEANSSSIKLTGVVGVNRSFSN